MPEAAIEIHVVVTSGDRDQKSHLTDIGGKGIFIRELEEALLDGTVDIAVHSFKDVTSHLAPSLTLATFLKPESVCDVMVTRGELPFEKLPEGAVIGTGSMRRKALLLRLRPDLCIVPIRGNIDTRIARVDRGDYDGIMLSEAGLIRLGLDKKVSVRFDPSMFYPAPGQGVVTVEIRNQDRDLAEICTGIGDAQQMSISRAELTLLETVGFDCRTPLGVYTSIENSILTMRGFFIDPVEGRFRERQCAGPLSDPGEVGKKMAALLLETRDTP
jgi:hydroxymethylbilane synthase